MLTLIMVIIFLLGWPFEWPAIILVFVPLMQPIIQAQKIDMLWFATLIAVNLQTAFLSPPVAMSAYYLKGVAPAGASGTSTAVWASSWSCSSSAWRSASSSPSIALWFPRYLFGK